MGELSDEERAARARELRAMLDEQRRRDDALVRELRELTGSGADQINDTIRGATGGRGHTAGVGAGGDGAQAINAAVRRAAGRPVGGEEGR